MNLDDIINSMTPEVYQRLSTAVELGKWPDGGELFAFLRIFNAECDVDSSYPSKSDATLPRLIRPTVGMHPAML